MGGRARRDQIAHRVNLAVEWLKAGRSVPEVIRLVSDAHGISPRQARRYVEVARERGHRVEVPEPKQVFTVKLSESLVQRLRETARERQCSLSSLVEGALEAHLDPLRPGPPGGGTPG